MGMWKVTKPWEIRSTRIDQVWQGEEYSAPSINLQEFHGPTFSLSSCSIETLQFALEEAQWS